jgi:truncated hemoglobin YjbI
VDEAASLKLKKSVGKQAMLTQQQVAMPVGFIPLNVANAKHTATGDTRRLVQAIGGLPTLRRFTATFYELSFADPHIDQFIRSHSDPHGERFACWIAEKFGDGTPWTDERRTRPVDVMQIGGQMHKVAYDRSSAHFAAWHSPKREAHKWGEHFKPEDARVWMRLPFWAARECGLFEPQNAAFMDYYVRFIGHFISIYSSKSPPFTRESARWSADLNNIEKYVASGNCMTDVVDKPLDEALAELPAEERVYTGSRHHSPSWPYNRMPHH